MTWKQVLYATDTVPAHAHLEGDITDLTHTFFLGKAGTIPASTAQDQADFLVIVPWDMTMTGVYALALTAPTSQTTARVRVATPSAGLVTFADLSATFNAVIEADQKVSPLGNPADVNVNAGQVLNFSIVGGGGSGTNILVAVLGFKR
jgi:hypothetical protein